MSGDQMTLIPLWQLILAGAVQVITFIWLLATLANRVTNVERIQAARETLLERVVKLESLADRLERMEDKLDKFMQEHRRTPR